MRNIRPYTPRERAFARRRTFPMHIPALLTPDEVTRAVRAACADRAAWGRAAVHDARGALVADPMRRCALRAVGARDALVARATARLRELIREDAIAFQHGALVLYAPGGRYDAHGDAAGLRGGTRQWTLLIGLRAARGGGATRFANNAKYALAPGDALLWPNYCASTGAERGDMDHAAEPVRDGHKLIASLWFGAPRAARAVR